MANVHRANGYIPIPNRQAHAGNNQAQAVITRSNYYLRSFFGGGFGTPLGGVLGWGALRCVPLVVSGTVVAAPVSIAVITVASIAGGLIGLYYGSRADDKACQNDKDIQDANNLLRKYPNEDGPVEILIDRMAKLEKYWKVNFPAEGSAFDILRNRHTALKHRLSNIFRQQLERVGVECGQSKAHENLCRLFVDLEYQLTNQFRIDARRMLEYIAAEQELTVLLRGLLEKNYLTMYHQTKSSYTVRHLELDSLLFQNIDPGTRYASSAWKFLYAIPITTLKSGAVFLGAAVVTLFAKNQHVLDMAMGGASTAALGTFWTDLQACYKSALSEKDQITKIHNLLKAQSQNEVALNQNTRLPEPIKQKIFQLDQEIDACLRRDAVAHARRLLYRRQGMLLSFPTEIKSIRRNPGRQDTQEHLEFVATVDENIEKLIRIYRDDIGPRLRQTINDIRGSSILHSGPNTGFTRRQIYLVGKPGVGKTHFVTNLAIALGLPMFKCSLSSREDIEDLVSRNHILPAQSDALIQGNDNDQKIMMMIPYALTKSGCLNPIIFFDEAGQVMSAGEQPRGNFYNPYDVAFVDKLKQLFDLNNKTLPLECIGNNFSIDFSRATIICAGNTAPPAQSPLGSRFEIIELPSLSAEKKRVIAQIAIQEALTGIYEQYKSEVGRLANLHIDTILNIDMRAEIPGAHKLKNAIASLVMQLYNSLIDERPIAEGDVRDWMEALYRQQD